MTFKAIDKISLISKAIIKLMAKKPKSSQLANKTNK